MRFKVNIDTTSNVEESTKDQTREKCERIATCIESYLTKYPHIALTNIFERTGVPETTLRRILQLKGNPQPEAAIKILQRLGFERELYNYMNDFHPDIARLIVANNSHNSEYELINEFDREFFVTEDYFAIVSMAYTSNGVTEREISDEFGKRGLERLLVLLEKGVVRKDGRDRYLGNIENYKLTLADGKRRVEHALKYYRLNEAGNINNWLSLQTESINKDGLKALKLLQQKHYNERKDAVFNNPVYRGDIKVYSATVSSTFLTYRPESAEVVQ